MVLIAGNRTRWAAEWKTSIFTTFKVCSLLEGAHKTPTAFYKKMYGKETRDFSQNSKNNNYTSIAKLSVPSSLQDERINVYVQLSCRNCFSLISVCCSVAIWTSAFIAKGTEQKNPIICKKKNPGRILDEISKTFQFIAKSVCSVIFPLGFQSVSRCVCAKEYRKCLQPPGSRRQDWVSQNERCLKRQLRVKYLKYLQRSAPYQLGNLNILKILAFVFTTLISKVICICSVKLIKISTMWWMMGTVWTAVWRLAPPLL